MIPVTQLRGSLAYPVKEVAIAKVAIAVSPTICIRFLDFILTRFSSAKAPH
jgi:hypothetical protein